MSVTLARGGKGDALQLRSPLLVAAGIAGLGRHLARRIEIARLGAFVTPTVSPSARGARGGGLLREMVGGALWSLPYRGISLRAVEQEHDALWRNWGVPVIISVPADDPDAAATIGAHLADGEAIAAVELDLASAMLARPGTPPDPADVRRTIRAVQRATPRPLLVKLGPSDVIVSLARTVADAGADALVLSGALPGATVDLTSRRLVRGALVGPAIHALVLRQVAAVARAVPLPVVASGGIAHADDAIAYVLAGATAVQLGSILLRDPDMLTTIADGIESYLTAYGEPVLTAIIGAAQEPENGG